jgi:hypothetical protein
MKQGMRGALPCTFATGTGQALVAGQVIEHGHSSLLHDSVWCQIDGLKCAEVHEGHFVVGSAEPGPLGVCGTQGTVEEELRTRIPHKTAPVQVKIGLDVE